MAPAREGWRLSHVTVRIMDENETKPAAVSKPKPAKKVPAAKAEAPAKKAEAAVQPAAVAGPPVSPRLPGGRVPRTAKR